jgi:hypothetical protein
MEKETTVKMDKENRGAKNIPYYANHFLAPKGMVAPF